MNIRQLIETVDPKEILAIFADLPQSKKFDSKQLIAGYKVELEHAKTVNYDKVAIAKIVLDHLAEFPDYYTKLTKAKL